MSGLRPCLVTSLVVLALSLCVGRAAADPETTSQARQFVEEHEKRVRPLDIAGNLAWWSANTTGKEADFKRKEEAQNKIDEALADPKVFARVKALEDNRTSIDDPVPFAPGRPRPLPALSGKAGGHRVAQEDDEEGQRRRESVQRIPPDGRISVGK